MRPEMTERATLCECRQWKAHAEHAEERLRHVAALLRIPDGARYLNDVRERAETITSTEADYLSLKTELATIFGPVAPRGGATWNAAMLARITTALVEAERE